MTADLASLLRVSAGSVLIRTPYLFLDVGASGIHLSDESLQTLMATLLQRQPPSRQEKYLICHLEGMAVNVGAKAFNAKKKQKKPSLIQGKDYS